MTISPSISPSAVNDAERATVEKFGFRLEDDNGQFDLVDPVVRKAERGRGGRYKGGNLELLLKAAVSQREAHDKAASVPSDEKPRSKASKQKTTVGEAAGSDATALIMTPGTTDAGSNAVDVTPKDAERTAGNDVKDGATNDTPKATTRKPRTAPATGNDNNKDAKAETPKRTTKPKEPKDRKLNRYVRAARVIVADMSLVEGLTFPHSDKTWGPRQAKMFGPADMSKASAGHCLEAWVGITSVLIEKGWLRLPKAPKSDASGK